MDTLKEYNITDINFTKLPTDEKIKILNIKTESDYTVYCGRKIAPAWKYPFFLDEEDAEVMNILNKMKPKPIIKKIPRLELFIPDNIKEDYKHFDTEYDVSRSKNQDKRLDYNKLNIEYLLNNFDDKTIYITEKLHNHFIKDNEIINLDIYECLLFNNIILNNIEEYMDNKDNIDKKLLNQYYTEKFRPYFYEKYKSQLKVINIEDERKLKIFDKIYKKVIINKYKKKENPKEYNNYCCNKKNLKNSYKMYLEGVPIEEIPISDKLQMILYIMDNCDFN